MMWRVVGWVSSAGLGHRAWCMVGWMDASAGSRQRAGCCLIIFVSIKLVVCSRLLLRGPSATGAWVTKCACGGWLGAPRQAT